MLTEETHICVWHLSHISYDELKKEYIDVVGDNPPIKKTDMIFEIIFSLAARRYKNFVGPLCIN